MAPHNLYVVHGYHGTADNYADFFTKVLPPKKFEAMRDIIMNTDVPLFTRRCDKSNCASDWDGPLPDDDKYIHCCCEVPEYVWWLIRAWGGVELYALACTVYVCYLWVLVCIVA